MHFDISSDFGGLFHDASKSYREHLQLSTHFVTEDIGTGMAKIAIDFRSPVIHAHETGVVCHLVVNQGVVAGPDQLHALDLREKGVYSS